ncbi:hypothetical protein WK80_06510 [Burkholderia multivorans]|nr:hypothetical protein WK80_06510 [Burkholderia multivorans]
MGNSRSQEDMLNIRRMRDVLETADLSYLRWNALYSERHRLLYVPTPKVACTSLKWWFAALLDIPRHRFDHVESGESDPELVIHDVLHRFAPESACVNIDVLAQCITDDRTLRFAVVRNPYQRIFSAWQSKLLVHEPQQSKQYRDCPFFSMPMAAPADIALGFEAFLEHLASSTPPVFGDPHWTPQVDLLKPDVLPYSCIAQIERKESLLSALHVHLGTDIADPFGGSRANESLLHYSPRFFTKRAEALIQQLYAADFEQFGYPSAIPEARMTVTDAELEIALRAIKLIRGRHERIGQMITSHATNIGVAEADETSTVRQLLEQIDDLKRQLVGLTEVREQVEKGMHWHQTQSAAWKARAEMLETELAGVRDFVAEQRVAIEWHSQERERWEAQAKDLAARLHTGK